MYAVYILSWSTLRGSLRFKPYNVVSLHVFAPMHTRCAWMYFNSSILTRILSVWWVTTFHFLIIDIFTFTIFVTVSKLGNAVCCDNKVYCWLMTYVCCLIVWYCDVALIFLSFLAESRNISVIVIFWDNHQLNSTYMFNCIEVHVIMTGSDQNSTAIYLLAAVLVLFPSFQFISSDKLSRGFTDI